MSDTKPLLRRARDAFTPPEYVMDSLIRRRRRKERNRKLSAGLVAIVLTLLSLVFLTRSFGGVDQPAVEPSPTPGGIFSSIGGWIVYGNDRNPARNPIGIWAVDPTRPGAPNDQILLRRGSWVPVAWSSDGSKLLIRRSDRSSDSGNLFVLDAEGTETRITSGDAWMGEATLSPDGSTVVFAAGPKIYPSRIYAVDSAGGTPHVLVAGRRRWFPFWGHRYRSSVYDPAFSPDGSQIAYIDGLGDNSHRLMVMNADGSGSRALTGDLFTEGAHLVHLVWSPDGTRLAFDLDRGIYTIGADGSNLALLDPDGVNPNWSPDGSHIAYERPTGYGPRGTLVVARADGTQVQRFHHARSGPWNPLVSEPTD